MITSRVSSLGISFFTVLSVFLIGISQAADVTVREALDAIRDEQGIAADQPVDPMVVSDTGLANLGRAYVNSMPDESRLRILTARAMKDGDSDVALYALLGYQLLIGWYGVAQEYPYMPMHRGYQGWRNHMWGWHGNGSSFIGQLMFWLLLLLVFILAVIIITRTGAARRSEQGDELRILKARYARGEITREQYEQIRRDLQD